MSKQFEPGMMVGSYKVLSLLGKGGMGEVFLAEDTRLDRKVALKILPAHLVHDPERLRRFTQEARAASALNHPNILTIYEVGEAEGAPYIATEFIHGETLREGMNAGHLTLREALDIAVQAAGALAAAHEAGIVHRDIKPENIMVRADGYIKILDFGLAKLTDRSASQASDTQAMTMTSPGMVMGTAQYMSPEQARGLPLDARTDLFSLGIVLYEMLAHRPPFEGDTPSHLIVAILDKSPLPITVAAPEAPPQLEPILDKALAKDREERYQTAKDLAVDLRGVRRRLDVETELRRSTPPAGYPAAATPPSGYPIPSQTHTAMQPAGASGGAQAAAALSSAPHPAQTLPSAPAETASRVQRRRKAMRRMLLVFLVMISAMKLPSVFKRLNRADRHSFVNLDVSRVTTSGNVYSAAISPDGRYIVYAQNDHGQASLWIRQTATASNVQIAPPAQVGYGGLAFSPDGNYLYFLRRSAAEAPTLFKMPVLGGSATPVLKNMQFAPTMSPDGKRMAFIRLVAAQPPIQQHIIVANTDGTGEKTLASAQPGELLRAIAWSPDGESIAATVLTLQGASRGSVFLYDAKNGSAKTVVDKKFVMVDDVAWSNADGDLVLLATDQLGATTYQIWHVDTEGGRMKRLTNDVNGFSALSASVATDQIVTIQPNMVSNLWIARAANSWGGKQITMGGARSDGAAGVTWAPDGRIVFHSRASGTDQIWIANADGTDARQLTTAGPNVAPAVTPDGKYVVFASAQTGSGQIWRINIDGSDARQLTNTKAAAGPSVSADSKWVLYHNFADNDNSIYRVPIDGGTPEKMAKGNCAFWGYSPDGKWILCGLPDANLTSVPKIGLLPASGGEVERTIDVPAVYASAYRFSPDSKALLYLYRKQGATNIWSQPISGGPPQQITNYSDGRIFSFALSMDGKSMAAARGDAMTDVVLLKTSDQ